MITNFKIFEDKRHLKKINFDWINPNGDTFKFKNISLEELSWLASTKITSYGRKSCFLIEFKHLFKSFGRFIVHTMIEILIFFTIFP